MYALYNHVRRQQGSLTSDVMFCRSLQDLCQPNRAPQAIVSDSSNFSASIQPLPLAHELVQSINSHTHR